MSFPWLDGSVCLVSVKHNFGLFYLSIFFFFGKLNWQLDRFGWVLQFFFCRACTALSCLCFWTVMAASMCENRIDLWVNVNCFYFYFYAVIIFQTPRNINYWSQRNFVQCTGTVRPAQTAGAWWTPINFIKYRHIATKWQWVRQCIFMKLGYWWLFKTALLVCLLI